MENYNQEVSFILKEIEKADLNTYRNCVIQLFDYLSNHYFENIKYREFENRKTTYYGWPRVYGNFKGNGVWTYPGKHEEALLLSYSLHSNIAKYDNNSFQSLLFTLYNELNLNQAFLKFKTRFFATFQKVVSEIISTVDGENQEINIMKLDTVFIIHGHDDNLKREVQLFLERGKVKNKILHELPDKGRTIIDKLVDETEDACFAIALFTPDDITIDQNKRARQNVILEVGYFIGKIGRSNVRMMLKDKIEIPSDLSGILYEKYNDNSEWKINLIRELRAAGVEVDSTAALRT